MEYLIIALALTIAAGGLTAAIAFPTLTHERDVAQAAVAAQQQQLTSLQSQLEAAKRDSVDAVTRANALAAGLRDEIARLNGELDEVHDPRVTAARLSGLFAPAAAAPGAAAIAGVPAQPAAHV